MTKASGVDITDRNIDTSDIFSSSQRPYILENKAHNFFKKVFKNDPDAGGNHAGKNVIIDCLFVSEMRLQNLSESRT